MKPYWHIHHDSLFGFSDNIKERIEYIQNNKPVNEIELRLKLLKPVRGKLPAKIIMAWKAYEEAGEASRKAWKAYNEASKAYEKARKTYNEAWKAYNEAVKACQEEIKILHDIECPNCPWNGETIFPN